jgi:hypothetical protein
MLLDDRLKLISLYHLLQLGVGLFTNLVDIVQHLLYVISVIAFGRELLHIIKSLHYL